MRFLIAFIFFATNAVQAASVRKKETLEDLSRDAYIWAYPSVLMKKTRTEMLKKVKSPRKPVNQFFHSTQLPDPTLASFIPPNTEYLYNWAWADLSQEPLVLVLPQIPDRYYSVQLVDAFSNVIQVISPRTHGEKGGIFIITSPRWSGLLPDDTTHISSPTEEIFVLAQTFVKGTKDATTVKRLMGDFLLISMTEWNKGTRKAAPQAAPVIATASIRKNLAESGLTFFEDLQQILEKNHPSSESDKKEMSRLENLGLKRSAVFKNYLQDPDARSMMERGLFNGEREIEARITAGLAPKVNGWNYELKSSPDSEDFITRAAVAKRALFSTPPEEIIHLSTEVDNEARQLNSAYRYVLHFDKKDLPPNSSFWSVRTYDSLTKEPSDPTYQHSSINNKNVRLKYNTDGSVDILIQRERPDPVAIFNWLALSRNSNFFIVLAIHHPGNTVLNRKYVAPSVIRIDEREEPKQRITHTMMAQYNSLKSRLAQKGHQ